VFEGFTRGRADIDGVGINYVVGGTGSPVLLLHGYPQTYTQWAKLVPHLIDRHTVVCADLRGYGDSDKPEPTEDSANYSFRAMAADQVALMTSLGFERFHVAGHDRGARVAHRLTLDHLDRVLSLTAMDIVPTWTMYNDVTRELAATYWQWYLLSQPAPLPERLIEGATDFYFEACLVRNGRAGLDVYDAEMLAEYRRCWSDPAMIHASCADYRAGISVDLQHDAEDLDLLLPMPVLALYAGDGLLRTRFDVEAVWAQRCASFQSAAVSGGHFFPELNPLEAAEAFGTFLAAADAGADAA